MVKRLPEPADQLLFAVEFAQMALQKAQGNLIQRCLLVIPEAARHQLPVPEGFEVTSYAQLPAEAHFDAILAIDLLSEVDDEYAAINNLQALLAQNGQLVLAQNNLMLRRGIVPPKAGGPNRSPTYYEFRSIMTDTVDKPEFSVGYLNDTLELKAAVPAGQVWPENLPPPQQAVTFLCSNKPMNSGSRQPPMGQPRTSDAICETSAEITYGGVRRLAFIVDTPDWAFDNIVENIAPYLAGRYEVTKFYISDHTDRIELLVDIFINNSFDNIHFMWRELWFNTLTTPSTLSAIRKKARITGSELAKRIAQPVITTTIYDHLFSSAKEIEDRELPLALTDAYSTASEILFDIYQELCTTPPTITTADGVATDFFNLPGSFDSNMIRAGWVGNSNWGKDKQGMGDDPKGLHSIVIPAIEALKNEGFNISLTIADKNISPRNREEMKLYYASEIDVLICASSYEGTPNPVLEAMASGKAWISTKVGIVESVAGPLQARFILPERSIESLKQALKEISEGSVIKELSDENLSASKRIDWAHSVADWTRLFKKAEENWQKKASKLRYSFILNQSEASKDRNIAHTEAPDPEYIDLLTKRVQELEDWSTKQKEYICLLEKNQTPKGIFLRVIRKILP